MVDERLRKLEFKRGLLQSAELGKGDKGPQLRHALAPRATLDGTALLRQPHPKLQVHHPAAGPERIPGPRRDPRAGLNRVANVVAQSADHVQSFFVMLLLELASYGGCLNVRPSSPAAGIHAGERDPWPLLRA
jgi:hypothetical protein